MPIFEYACRACGHEFELLILPSVKTVPACPECASEDLERLLSGFGVSSAELREARTAAKKKAVMRNKNYVDKRQADTDHVVEHVKEYREMFPSLAPKKKD